MPAPVIGLTTSRQLNPHGFSMAAAAEAYISALIQAGATPLLIPLGLPQETLPEIASRLDGILFSGGGDIHPSCYHSEWHPQVDNCDEDRDRVELGLFQAVLRDEKPFLGICRGLQLVNVALGGTLYEDIQDQRPPAIQHSNFPDQPRHYLAHTVQVETGTRLGQILQAGELSVNSLHHQGIRDLSPRLQAAAFSPDGLIEAVELPDYPFGLGVQWHPEWLTDQSNMRDLFRAFVSAARAARQP